MSTKMTTKIPCYIQFTDNGRFAKLVHKSGMIIAEFMIYDSNFMNRALACYDRFGMMNNFPRPEDPYRAEVEEIDVPEVISEEIDNLRMLLSEVKQKQFKLAKLAEETEIN